jgi:phosphate-selective porin
MRLAWTAMFVVAMAGLAFAADGGGDEKKPTPAPTGEIDPGDRIGRLEREIEQLKTVQALRNAGLSPTLSLEEQDKPAPKPGEAEFKASFTDGFHIKTADGNFDLHVGGRWEEEFRNTFGRNDTSTARTAVNTFYTREAFITLDGTIFKNFGFKINGDFTPPQTQVVAAVPATITTGAIAEEFWVEWKEFREFRIMFGQYKQPISFETTDSPRFAEFIQRSPMARFAPNFDTGIKFYGSIAESTLMYELSVTNGRSHLANTGRNNIDDNDGLEWAIRVSTAPFIQDKESPLKILRIGAYASYANEGRLAAAGATGFPGNISTNELGTNFFQFGLPAGTIASGARWRVGAEFTYAYGPFMVRGEFMERVDTLLEGAASPLLRTLGYYAEATVVLTGEDRLPNTRITPLHNLNLGEGTFGAVEFAIRYGGVCLTQNSLAAVGNTLGANSNGARSLTTGFNWWLCSNMKICADFVYEMFNSAIALNAALPNATDAKGFLMRFQVDF